MAYERSLPVRVRVAMWRNLKTRVQTFRRGAPGERFKAQYRARRNSGEKRAAFSTALNLVLALVCFALGIVFSLMPVIPGFIFFFASAVLLAAESFRVAHFLDVADLKLRSLWRRSNRRREGKGAP